MFQNKIDIMHDDELLLFYTEYFSNKDEASRFLKKCLKKLSTYRMMLRVKWYSDIANGMPKVSDARPALQIVFLMALAESIATRRYTKKQVICLGSQKLVLNFFKYITRSDKFELERKVKRLHDAQKLRISSIVRILYQVRNDAIHGEEFWNFSLLNKDFQRKEGGPQSLVTSGLLGRKSKKQRVILDVQLTYEDLRDVFIRTAIKNIESEFR